MLSRLTAHTLPQPAGLHPRAEVGAHSPAYRVRLGPEVLTSLFGGKTMRLSIYRLRPCRKIDTRLGRGDIDGRFLPSGTY